MSNLYSKDLAYPPISEEKDKHPRIYSPRQLADFWGVNTAFVSALIGYGRLPVTSYSGSGRASLATGDIVLWLDQQGVPFPEGQETEYATFLKNAASFRKGSQWIAENKALRRVAARFENAED